MKTVLLMRHAKSSWQDASLPDHQRPLNKRGKDDAPRMGRHVWEQGIVLDAILCSTALRARDTAKRFLKEYPFDGEVDYIDELYLAAPETISDLLKQLPEEVETAMVIAHNPGLDSFLEAASDEYEHMPTACVAHLRFPIESWADLREGVSGELLDFWKPRDLANS